LALTSAGLLACTARGLEPKRIGDVNAQSDRQPRMLATSGPFLYFEGQDDAHGRELWRTDGTSSGTVMVTDLSPGALVQGGEVTPNSSMVQHAVDAGGTLFFVATAAQRPDGVTLGLWKTDGSSPGTSLLHDFSDFLPSDITEFTGCGDLLYFLLDDPTLGKELWVSSGTVQGTHIITDMVPGLDDIRIHSLTPAGDILFFLYGTRELWRTMGTEASTQRVRRIDPFDVGNGTYGSLGSPTAVGAMLYFVADTAAYRSELWATNGTGTALVANFAKKVWRHGPYSGEKEVYEASGAPRTLRSSGGEIYCTATTGGDAQGLTHEDELTISLCRGTRKLAELNVHPSQAVAVGDRFYYVVGNELWRTVNGVGAGRVLAFDSGAAVGTLYARGPYLLREADGTHSVLVESARAVPRFESVWGLSSQLDALPLGNRVLYFADVRFLPDSGGHYLGWSLGALDVELGEPRFTRIAEISTQSGIPANGAGLEAGRTAGGIVVAATDGGKGVEPHIVTQKSVNMLRDINEFAGVRDPDWHGSDPRYFVSYGTDCLFTTTSRYIDNNGEQHRFQIWRTDGTAAGTVALHTWDTGAGESMVWIPQAGPWAVVGDRAFLATSDGLWVTQGTAETTTRLLDGSVEVTGLTPCNNVAVFALRTGQGEPQMWTSDGTPAGTAQLIDFDPAGQWDGCGNEFFRWNGALWFAAMDNQDWDGNLWRSDGTPEGTQPAVATPGAGKPYNFFAFNGKLYFLLRPQHYTQLWCSDGTPEGTTEVFTLVNELAFQFDSSLQFCATDSAIFIAGRRIGTYETLLYSTDGTARGTQLLKNFNAEFRTQKPGATRTYLYAANQLINCNGTLYFRATDQEAVADPQDSHGWELWRSDGTPEGTRMVVDLLPGPGHGVLDTGANSFIDGHLYFAGTAGRFGFEPWRLEIAPPDQETYTLTMQVDPVVPRPGGTVTAPAAKTEVAPGIWVDISCIASDTFEFAGWSDSPGAELDWPDRQHTRVRLTANATVTAHFLSEQEIDEAEGRVSLKVASTYDGTARLQPTEGCHSFAAGTRIQAQADTMPGWIFVGWTATDGIDIDDPEQTETMITVNAPGTLLALYDDDGIPYSEDGELADTPRCGRRMDDRYRSRIQRHLRTADRRP
jgi:ELWxxDGT repeat protein